MSTESAFGLIFLCLALFLGCVAGVGIGTHVQQNILINDYCLHAEYDRYVMIDNIEYCKKGDNLMVIEWLAE